MSLETWGVDCIYVAASAHDARFTRLCVASIRYVYPDVPIRILVGGPLQPGLAEELRRVWNVSLADFPRGDYGWGFVKLEPLFAAAGERFLVLDSDTVMTGPVLDLALAHPDADLIVDEEDQSPEAARTLYFDDDLAASQGRALPRPDFLFNSGQWFGRSGVIGRDDFDGLIDWGWPPRLSQPRIFKNGDQGVLNFVANRLAREGRLKVARAPLMRWPGHGMAGLDATAIRRHEAPARVVHWAGMKGAYHQRLIGADVLELFERMHYAELRGGEARRRAAAASHAFAYWRNQWRVRLRLARSRLMVRSHSAP